MKFIITIVFTGVFLSSCSTSSDEADNNTNLDSLSYSGDPLQNEEGVLSDEVIHADYEEFYESGALKIEGNFDENEARNGLWISYYENGLKWSESFYGHGKKEGHSVTFFPNGKIRYVGEYKNDQKIGLWRFYNEAGDLETEETY